MMPKGHKVQRARRKPSKSTLEKLRVPEKMRLLLPCGDDNKASEVSSETRANIEST